MIKTALAVMTLILIILMLLGIYGTLYNARAIAPIRPPDPYESPAQKREITRLMTKHGLRHHFAVLVMDRSGRYWFLNKDNVWCKFQ
jgi:hypothetical protein